MSFLENPLAISTLSTSVIATLSAMTVTSIAVAARMAKKQSLEQDDNAKGRAITSLSSLKNACCNSFFKFSSKDFTEIQLCGIGLCDHDLLLSLTCLRDLVKVNLSRNNLEKFPVELLKLTRLTDLNMAQNKLVQVPREIGELRLLKKLNLMCNFIEAIPESIGQLEFLEVLGLKGNRIASLPESIGQCCNLVELYVTDNKLQTLPAGIGNCKQLRKIQASFNDLTYLPEELSGLTSLELFRMAGNPALSDVPSSLTQLPAITWLSLAGSLWSPGLGLYNEGSLKAIEAGDIILGEKLGEGASGSVYASTLDGEDVAVKVFKGEISPDGRAIDELEISCAIEHQNITKVIGVIPGPQPWVVMKLVPSSYQPLADRPDSTSVLRCRWDTTQVFSAEKIMRIGVCVARAMQYLHSSGIAHGDLYAHNVLSDSYGYAVLCDFGSSFMYPSDYDFNFEAVEVRAFGIFMAELSLLGGAQVSWIAQDLSSQCLRSKISDRPTFLELGNQLEAELMQEYKSVPIKGSYGGYYF